MIRWCPWKVGMGSIWIPVRSGIPQRHHHLILDLEAGRDHTVTLSGSRQVMSGAPVVDHTKRPSGWVQGTGRRPSRVTATRRISGQGVEAALGELGGGGALPRRRPASRGATGACRVGAALRGDVLALVQGCGEFAPSRCRAMPAYASSAAVRRSTAVPVCSQMPASCLRSGVSSWGPLRLILLESVCFVALRSCWAGCASAPAGAGQSSSSWRTRREGLKV